MKWKELTKKKKKERKCLNDTYLIKLCIARLNKFEMQISANLISLK